MNPLLAALGVVLVLGLVWLVATYNRFVRLRQHIRESWSDIDVELKRRYELIPNLVETVRGYTEHERGTLQKVVELRDKALRSRGSAASQAVDESALLIGLKGLFAVVENYPELKADTHFLALQKELANTEDRIAAARRFFNGNVRDLNVLRDSFPASVISGMFSVKPATYFELENAAERVVPRVEIA
jgi:LemA protein